MVSVVGKCLKNPKSLVPLEGLVYEMKKSNEGCKSFIHHNYQRSPRYLNIKTGIICCGNCSFWEIKL